MRRNVMKQSSSGQRRSLFVRVAAVVIALCMIAALALPALASETGDTYTYTVRIFAGKQGTIDGKDVKEYSVTPGQKLNVDWNELKKLIKVTDSRYEATGFRLSGKDNNLYPKTIAEPIVVNSDMDFVVSYALKGSDIQYTIKYLEAGTNKELHKPATLTYYGNEGEEFVPTYIYIDGYTPKDPVTTAVKLKNGMTFTCYYTKIAGTGTTKTTTKEGTTTTTTKSGTTSSTKKNSNSTTTTKRTVTTKRTTTTTRRTTTTTRRTTTTTRRVGTASSSTSTVRSGSTSSYTNPSSYTNQSSYTTTTTTRSYTPNPAGTTAAGNSAGTTTGGNTSGSTTTTTRNISGTTASGNTTGTTPGSNTGNRFTANSGNTTNGTNPTGTTPGSTANGTNPAGTTPGSTANGTNPAGTTPGNTLSGVTNGTSNAAPGTTPAGAQGNEAAQTSPAPKEIANLDDPNTNLKDYSSSGNNTAEVEPTEDKSSETTTNSELEGVVRAHGMSTPVKVLLGAAIVLLLGGAGWFFFKRFSSEGYTDDDDDTDDDQV